MERQSRPCTSSGPIVVASTFEMVTKILTDAADFGYIDLATIMTDVVEHELVGELCHMSHHRDFKLRLRPHQSRRRSVRFGLTPTGKIAKAELRQRAMAKDEKIQGVYS